MTVSRLPGHQTKDIILRLSLETSRLLAMAASRENVDAEVIVERIIDKFYSPDGRTKSERAQVRADEAQIQLRKHHRELGLTDSNADMVKLANSADTDVVAEVERLVRLVRLVNG